MLPALMVENDGKVMTIVTGLSNSCILEAHHHPSTGHRRLAFAGLKMESILYSSTITDNRERASVQSLLKRY
jgi:hypothetical protein